MGVYFLIYIVANCYLYSSLFSIGIVYHKRNIVQYQHKSMDAWLNFSKAHKKTI